MPQPRWANIKYDEINLQKIKYYSAPTKKEKLNSLDEVDPEILKNPKKVRNFRRGTKAFNRSCC